MVFVRMILPLGFAAALAACSGNLGGGQSTLPGTPQGTTGLEQAGAPTPTPTPNSASNVASIGDSVAPQALPAVMGWGGTIAFAKPASAPSPSPNAKAAPTATPAEAAGPVSIGVTAAVVEPADAPHFGGSHKSTGKHADTSGTAGLLFISLLATADVTLATYPAIALDVPREIAAKYHDRPFGLALYDPETKSKTYRLSVAERDLASPAPGSEPTPAPTVAPTVAATVMPSGAGMQGAMPAFTPPPVGSGIGSSGLPPERVAFVAAPSTLTLRANRPVVFVLYAGPAVAASPSPSSSPGSSGSPAASPLPAASSSAAASPSPSAPPAPAVSP